MHQHTACSPIARESADFGLRLNEGCCMSNGIEEFPTQSATLLFVPADGGVKLFPCCFEISQCPGHCPRNPSGKSHQRSMPAWRTLVNKPNEAIMDRFWERTALCLPHERTIERR